MAEQDPIEKMKMAHPVDAELFGPIGAAAAHICKDLAHCFVDKRFEFMDPAEYQAIGRPSEMMCIYWREMLFRVYWAAALNLMRHQRWQAGCVGAFNAPANLLAFAASLRGLLEAAPDAWYSLRQAPGLLAENRHVIEAALNRSADKFGINQEFEDRLIHFIYARKVGKSEKEMTPDSHIARAPKDYRNSIGLPDDEREALNELYDELCGICHPTVDSLTFLWEQETTGIRIREGLDDLHIRRICHKYERTIGYCLSLSVTLSALCLKALNLFSLPETRCPQIERWDFNAIPAWRKAQAAASRGTVQ
jgi:hypothetical protein